MKDSRIVLGNLIDASLQFKTAPGAVHSIASDGPHVFLQTDQGMYKIGSGYGGTVKGRVYAHRPDFEPRDTIQYCPKFHGRCLRFFDKILDCAFAGLDQLCLMIVMGSLMYCNEIC